MDTKPKEWLLSVTVAVCLTQPHPLVEERRLRVTGLTFRSAGVLSYMCPCHRPLKICLDTGLGERAGGGA